jgi:membrane protease subunit HflC
MGLTRPVLIGIAGLIIVLLLASLSDAFFTVSETQQAIVLQFGAVKAIDTHAGLKTKTPWLQNVVIYEKRLLNVESPPQEVILSDQRRLVVDAFAVYRIVDPLKFYQAVRTEEGAQLRLTSSMIAILRDVLQSRTSGSAAPTFRSRSASRFMAR